MRRLPESPRDAFVRQEPLVTLSRCHEHVLGQEMPVAVYDRPVQPGNQIAVIVGERQTRIRVGGFRGASGLSAILPYDPSPLQAEYPRKANAGIYAWPKS